MIGPVIVVSMLVAGAIGRLHRRTVDRTLAMRYRRSESGIILGAEPFYLEGNNGAAVLLVHGGGDTPQTMRGLATTLHNRGYSVSAPLLPGHGRDLTAFAAHNADDWYGEVHDEFVRLRDNHAWVGVVGLSMGGALSARLTAETEGVGALVLASPYLTLPPIGSIAARTSWLWGAVVPAIRTSSSASVLDPEARAASLGYGAFTPGGLRSLRVTAMRGREALSRIKVPTLVLQSTTDNRVSTKATEDAFKLLGAKEKSMRWIEGAGHVITVDYGWEGVAQQVVDWMDSHRPAKKTKGA